MFERSSSVNPISKGEAQQTAHGYSCLNQHSSANTLRVSLDKVQRDELQ